MLRKPIITNESAVRIVKRKICNTILKKSNRKGIWKIVIFSVLIILAACSPKQGSKLIKFFFDGVPEKKQDSANLASNSSSGVGVFNKPAKDSNQASVKSDSINFYYHPPFKEKACATCHKGDDPGSMAHFQNDVCLSCHPNFSQKYSYVHGPVAAGECSSCHFPHVADNKNLLRRKGQDLCLFCHTQSMVMKNTVHANIGNSSCISCHNAHGGKDRFLLTAN